MSSAEHIDRANDLTQTSPIPLTTVFTQDEGCMAETAYTTLKWTNNALGLYLDKDGAKTSCYPSGYRELQRYSNLWYSPGVCPQDYTYAATTISTYTDAPATTFAICCPWSISNVYNTEPVCWHAETPDISKLPTRTTYAAAISVAWQESDLSLFTPKSAPVSALQKAGLTVPSDPYKERTITSESVKSTSETSDTQGRGEEPRDGGGGLGTGALAGIGVGATLAVTIILGTLWWLMRRYRITRKKQDVSESGQPWIQQAYKAPDTTINPVEMADTTRAELHG